ncbi:MAG: DNA translocase FtsK, partial [Turicibacter sp.]|nr:DNA translocase FtsK [Turicibacter sp.]
MANKKKVKHKKQTILNELYLELIGIGLILLATLMIGQLGLIGTFFKRLGLFIFGEFFWLIGIGMFVCGWRMVIKRQIPTFFSSKHIGWYLDFISLISFSHLPVYREFNAHDISLLGGIWSYYWANDILNSSITVGGGLIGSVIYGLLVPLVTAIGLYFISLLTICYGTLLICELTIKDVYDGLKTYQKKQRKHQVRKKRSPKVKKLRQPLEEAVDIQEQESLMTIINDTMVEEENIEIKQAESQNDHKTGFNIKEFDKYLSLEIED